MPNKITWHCEEAGWWTSELGSIMFWPQHGSVRGRTRGWYFHPRHIAGPDSGPYYTLAVAIKAVEAGA